MRRRKAAALAGAALTAVLTGCTAGSAGGATPATGAGGPSGSAAEFRPCPEQPDRAAAGDRTLPPLTIDCVGGGSLDLARAPGTPTVVNLWGSWCTPCRAELPLMQQLADSAGDRVHVVGVISKDGLPQAGSFAADAGVTFPSAFDGEGQLMTDLGLNALPYTYFLDAGGALTYTQTGPVQSVDELRTLVAEHLGVQL